MSVEAPAVALIAPAEAPAVEPMAGVSASAAAPEPTLATSAQAGEPARPAKRRSRSRRAERTKTEAPADQSAAPAQLESAGEAASAAPEDGEAVADEAASEVVVEAVEAPNILEAPAVGVEIISTEERQGVVYFTIRDLRNCNTVHNVTAESARKLWSYAINQYLKRPLDPARVTWRGDYGLWQIGRRAKKLRYDLVRRLPDGALRVYYGVTADGMDGPWAQFLKDEDRPE